MELAVRSCNVGMYSNLGSGDLGSRLVVNVKYFGYIWKHKWYVFRAGIRIGGIPIWRLIIHDWSKFSPAEFGAYRDRFFGGRAGVEEKDKDPDSFRRAWLHHLHRNPHHWDHWVFSDGKPIQMPAHFIREMVADWLGAGKAITGNDDIREWYNRVKEKQIMTNGTRLQVDLLVSKYGKGE